ncbi:glycosyltransferase family 2 protein [Methanosarcina sp. MSH10X1]|uniref:glycosyltransferase family 2 protein n=1 Tax=Methanosarcina sp. MSH10X1 TaxID=2507075 RepID=UPI000FFC7609|nr:glycosyltransferase family 2 protein [Methanosarcina sp. MSH10X1]RXA19729.1 glycosyltransferase family 2 protein [Methanosarcina sp. MSH10X1]
MGNRLLAGKSETQMRKYEEKACKSSTSPQNITVILPAYNEEVSIGSIVLLTRFYADNVIVVDDGSSDRTAEVARKAGAEVIVHKVNQGKGGALKTGFTAAADLGADVIVTMDSDGQHNPADIPKLVAPIIEGSADLVNGSRYLNGLDRNTPVYRRVGQTILDRFTNLSSGLTITDSQSGFRAFAASTKDLFRFNAQGMAIESEMLADAGKSGLRIKEVEIGVRYDINSNFRNPIKFFAEILLRVMEDLEVNRPLYFYSVPGFALATVALYMGVRLFESFYLGVESVSFGLAFLMIFLALLGIFMTVTGIVMYSMAGLIKQAKSVQ